jgi:hypothetical protein
MNTYNRVVHACMQMMLMELETRASAIKANKIMRGEW